MSGKTENKLELELLINILGADVLKPKKHVNISIAKDLLPGLILKE